MPLLHNLTMSFWWISGSWWSDFRIKSRVNVGRYCWHWSLEERSTVQNETGLKLSPISEGTTRCFIIDESLWNIHKFLFSVHLHWNLELGLGARISFATVKWLTCFCRKNGSLVTCAELRLFCWSESVVLLIEMTVNCPALSKQLPQCGSCSEANKKWYFLLSLLSNSTKKTLSRKEAGAPTIMQVFTGWQCNFPFSVANASFKMVLFFLLEMQYISAWQILHKK